VAKGIYDAYLHHRAFPWDFCAGTIIVQEAGGKVTDHKGNPLDWTRKDNMFLLASNSLLHDQILAIIRGKK
jgi:myo-inositol-1(or 4)-monophosphatase